MPTTSVIKHTNLSGVTNEGKRGVTIATVMIGVMIIATMMIGLSIEVMNVTREIDLENVAGLTITEENHDGLLEIQLLQSSSEIFQESVGMTRCVFFLYQHSFFSDSEMFCD